MGTCDEPWYSNDDIGLANQPDLKERMVVLAKIIRRQEATVLQSDRIGLSIGRIKRISQVLNFVQPLRFF